MNVVGIIPARLQSSRLPQKLLLKETGRPLIQYVWEVAESCDALSEVIVATDSHEIAEAVRSFGGRAELTGEHPSGTDRVAEVVRQHCPRADVVVNLQGDEPELESDTIEKLVAAITKSGSEMATVAAPIVDPGNIHSSDCVKVVLNDQQNAMYFSRHAIPYSREQGVEAVLAGASSSPWLLHVGLYAYRRDFLLQLTSMPPSSLERLEKLEQLRALQSGATIAVAVTAAAAVGIDTADDYAAFVNRMASQCS